MAQNQGNNTTNRTPHDTDNTTGGRTLAWALSRLSIHPPQPSTIPITTLTTTLTNLSLTPSSKPIPISVIVHAQASLGIIFYTKIHPGISLASFLTNLNTKIPDLIFTDAEQLCIPPVADFSYAILTAPHHLFSANIKALDPEVDLWDWVDGMVAAYMLGIEGRGELMEGLRLELRMV